MSGCLLRYLITRGRAAAEHLRRRVLAATRPAVTPLAVGTLADLARSKPALVAENAFLRHQLVILHRSVTRPRCCAGIASCFAGPGVGGPALRPRHTARHSRPRP